MSKGYLVTNRKEECFGCESCAQICPKVAIEMSEDEDGFRYPVIDNKKCIHCSLCNKSCPVENPPHRFKDEKYVFGGYVLDKKILEESTSGGAFSAIAEVYCVTNYAIYGATANKLDVYHTRITDKSELSLFRNRKYSHSAIRDSDRLSRKDLLEGKSVLFSGTPCQIAGLKTFLKSVPQDKLLTVEVVCEGVPSPLYFRKFNDYCISRYGGEIEKIDYRDKDQNKWDFQVMAYKVKGKLHKIDRWFNPFWSIWLNHLMSRPSCYSCPFATQERVADIALGDLWGVHIYCPDLYGRNGGSSLVTANSKKGKAVVKEAESLMFGHELSFDTALKYQSPMRKHIDPNPKRAEFMQDLRSDLSYTQINKKWAKKPSIKLLWVKYIWGNRQKVALWNILHKEK